MPFLAFPTFSCCACNLNTFSFCMILCVSTGVNPQLLALSGNSVLPGSIDEGSGILKRTE